MFDDLKQIRAFLFERMYRAPRVVEMRARVTKVVEDLFPFFMDHPDYLPGDWQPDVAQADGNLELARIVVDYIAGMTDRYALEQHRRYLEG